MATTGFWPVKGRLKEVIDYANNPDKTTAKEYLDEDLYAAIRYVENDDSSSVSLVICQPPARGERLGCKRLRNHDK